MESIDPAEWGGDAWRFLHTMARAYPVTPDSQTRRAMFRLLEALETLLPCEQCRRHFVEYMRKTGVRSSESGPLLSGKALESWLDAAHKHANSHRDARLAQEAGGAPVGAAGGAVTGATAAGATAAGATAAGGAVTGATAAGGAVAGATAADKTTPPSRAARIAGPSRAVDVAKIEVVPADDTQRRNALIGCFSVIAVVLVAVFVAFVIVTAQHQGFARRRA